MKKSKFLFLETRDGFKIATSITSPDFPKALVILCHGITVDSTEGGFFIEFEKLLIASNYIVVRFDFRCHGKSSGLPKDLTLSGEYIDIDTVFNFIKNNFNYPIYIEATSFSGSAVIKKFYNVEQDCRGLILFNPVINYKKTFLEPSTSWVKSILDTTNQINNDSGLFARLPGTNYYITSQMVNEFQQDETMELLMQLSKPILAFHGEIDTKIPYEFLSVISKKKNNIDFYLLENVGHGFKGKRTFVMEKTIEWMDSHFY